MTTAVLASAQRCRQCGQPFWHTPGQPRRCAACLANDAAYLLREERRAQAAVARSARRRVRGAFASRPADDARRLVDVQIVNGRLVYVWGEESRS